MSKFQKQYKLYRSQSTGVTMNRRSCNAQYGGKRSKKAKRAFWQTTSNSSLGHFSRSLQQQLQSLSSRYHRNSTKVAGVIKTCTFLCTAHEYWLEQAEIQTTSSAYTQHDWDQSSWHMDFIPMTRSPASHSSLMILAVVWKTKHHPNLPLMWEFDADECWTTPWAQEIHITFKTLLLNTEGQNSFSNLHSSIVYKCLKDIVHVAVKTSSLKSKSRLRPEEGRVPVKTVKRKVLSLSTRPYLLVISLVMDSTGTSSALALDCSQLQQWRSLQSRLFWTLLITLIFKVKCVISGPQKWFFKLVFWTLSLSAIVLSC